MGEFFALACALVWAFAVILFRKSGETFSPLALNLFRVTLSSVFFLVTLLFSGQQILGRAPLADYLILMASGVIGIAIADTLFHASLNRVGAGINAIVNLLYSPFVILFAFLMLDERLGVSQFIGMGLVVSGVIVSTRIKAPAGTTGRDLFLGIFLGACTMGFLAFGIVFAKPVLERSDIIWATAIRQFGALLVLVPGALLSPSRKEIWSIFRPQAAWKFSIPGTILGSYLALMLWVGGMKLIPAGKASILNQTSTIYLLVFASLFLKEPFTRKKLIAALLALAGVLLVLDMIMNPGMDGLETYQKILKYHPEQKAIIASGYSESQQVKDAQNMGAGIYVKKPYSFEKIGLAVKDELSK